MILRLLGWQGVAGIAVACALALLLLVQKGETRHWRRQSGHYEQLYRSGEAALAATVANYRAAADRARTADQANLSRVAAAQAAITERTADDYQTRLAAARARSDQLRRPTAAPASDPGARGTTPVPGLSIAARGPAQATGQNGLPHSPSSELGTSEQLIATEQAIQLDELIKWIRRQHSVDPNSPRP